jgi:hypothetical protein
MDQPSPSQFDIAGAALSAIDYPTLQAMLSAGNIVSSARSGRLCASHVGMGTLADRIAYFAGRSAPRRTFGGAFLPRGMAAVKRKGSIYLGASVSGRIPSSIAAPTLDAAMADSAEEKP